MALIKLEEQLSGFSVSYWKIARINILPNSLEVSVFGYLDKAARDNGKQPAQYKDFELTNYALAELDEANKNPYSIAYNKLKSDIVFFSDATDDL